MTLGELLSPHPSPTLRMIAAVRFFPRLILTVACACVAFATRAIADDVRFSATLTAAQRDHAGLTQLSADNVAVIDGLIRQDEAASKFRDNDVDHTRFSQRRTRGTADFRNGAHRGRHHCQGLRDQRRR
jgi:hypothetical protein